MKRNHISNILKFCIFLAIGVFFIYWFLIKLEPEQKAAIWQSFVQADYKWVLVAMLSCVVAHLLRALRWQLLFHTMGYTPRLNNIFGSVMVAYLGNLVFPRLGEVARCATMQSAENIPLEKSIGTVLTERIFDVIFFGVIIVIGLLATFGSTKDWIYNTLSQYFDRLPTMLTLALSAVALLTVAMLLYRLLWRRLMRIALFRKLHRLAAGCIDGIRSIFRLGTKKLTLFILYSALLYLCYIVGGQIILQAFGETRGMGFGVAFVIYLFGSVGMTFSQGGIGVYPVMVQMALIVNGISEATGAATGWLWWGTQQTVVVVGGLAYLVYFSLKKRKNKQAINTKP